MASPILHIKDAYYFEVPKFLWPSNREDKADFPDVWVKLDPEFQLWEAEQLHGKLSQMTGDVPDWPELQEQYLEWKHDHANFGKPLDVMLDEHASQAQSEFKDFIEADEANVQKSFEEFVEDSAPFAWFTRKAGDESFGEQWQTAKRESGDIAAYKALSQEWSPDKIEAYNHHLSGKILVPQPFGGELRNLYEPESGFCVSKFMVVEVAVALIMLFVFWRLGKKLSSGGAPRGKLTNLLESFLVYLRDHVARPAIGEHDGDRFVPLLWTFFMFVLGCNLCGLLPWVGAPTGTFGVTTGLALVTLVTGMICGMRKFGPHGYFLNQVPSMDLPLILAIPIKPMILVIEIAGLGIRHAVLAIRLLANMVAGHLVLLGIMGLAFGAVAAASFASAPDWKWWLTAVISVVASTLFSLLELLVAFLQAYIFTFLSALFIGAVIHHH